MGANSALIFGIIINVAILLVFFRFLMQLAAVSPYKSCGSFYRESH